MQGLSGTRCLGEKWIKWGCQASCKPAGNRGECEGKLALLSSLEWIAIMGFSWGRNEINRALEVAASMV